MWMKLRNSKQAVGNSKQFRVIEMIESYKDLIVWQKCMNLAEAIQHVTEYLPSSENYGLRTQIRRAVVSVPSNIAEGYGRQSTGSYKQFLMIARGSLLELETQIQLCVRLKYIESDKIISIETLITEISKMLTSLISKLTQA